MTDPRPLRDALDGVVATLAVLRSLAVERRDAESASSADGIRAETRRIMSLLLPEAAVADIVAAVGAELGMTPAQILGDRRTARHVLARQMVMWVGHQRGLNNSQIARGMGTDPGTVHYGLRIITKALTEAEEKHAKAGGAR